MFRRRASLDRSQTDPPQTGAASGSSTERVVVVGGGMAGHHLLEALVARGGSEQLEITLLCEEVELPYDRVHLGAVVEGEVRPPALREPDWYSSHGLVVRQKTRVTSVDSESKQIHTATGDTIEYDQLVLATGSTPFVPPVPGADLPGVVAYRTFEDAQRIAREARTASHVTVIGGGLLGIEVARGIQKQGCDVDIVEMAPRLLPRQLDVDGAAILEGAVRSLGIALQLQARTEGIVEKHDRLEVQLDGDRRIATDLVLFAVGTRPQDALARDSGIECHRDGGILVDDALATKTPGIHAIGECVRHRDQTYGFVAPCYRMAEVLADILLGGEERFEGAPVSAKLKLAEIDVAAVGESLADGTLVRDLVWRTEDSYRRIVLRDGRLVGAIAVGPMPEFAQVQSAVADGVRIRVAEERRFEERGELWRAGSRKSVTQWSDAAIVCTCTGVTCGALRKAWADGCHSSLALSEATGAATGCGTCRPLLAELAGETTNARRESAGRGLGLLGVAALILFAGGFALGPVPMNTSVLETPQIDFLWRDSFWKQVSGFTLIGVMALGLLLPIRDRLPALLRPDFKQARFLHSAIGVASVFLVGLHSGLRMGVNLNWMLMACVVGLMALGGGSAFVTSLEHRLPPRAGALLRSGWKQAHVLLFLPVPVLLLFHVLAVYFY